ncbi:hypothetical protein ELS19_15730 [Halogeometricum borinquense]|uniref:Transmembrane glycoprotein / HTH domain protein n=1 Tax=Halogeometricum borinquense TaxID=60847 RepID=A0A482TET8_9EURY|nr:hypothetical protein [Halogeometricum borinquense]RYJ15252.1 hypothetical protein ELS19_15730 [Halogeometricum borinquense]
MRTPALVVALLLVFSGVIPAAVSAGTTDSDAFHISEPDTVSPAQLDDALSDQPRTEIRVALQDNGDAKWRVEVRYTLDAPNETAAFERLGQAYENRTTDAGVDADLFRRIADRASESTGREMRIRNATYEYSLDREAETGTLAVEFRWTNFLRKTEDGGLALDDVFVLPSVESEESRTWLSLLGSDQQLVIETPPGYGTNNTSIPVKPQKNGIVIDGPSTFEGGDRLVVTYYRSTEKIQEIPWDLVVGGGILAALLIVVAAVILRWRSDSGRKDGPETHGPPSETDSGATNGGVSTSTPATSDDVPPERPVEDAAEAEEDEVDLSLLSDEERVEYLLEESGGRMKQANIVKETGWSDAKVSQLLSSMADEGRVDKLRLGRENLISLPGEDENEE